MSPIKKMALGQIGDKSAVEPLIEALKDKHQRVRLSALGALKELTNQDFGRYYDKWMEWFTSLEKKEKK